MNRPRETQRRPDNARRWAALLVPILSLGIICSARAEAIIRVFEEESQVHMMGEGTLNVEDLFLIGSEPFNGGGYTQGSFFVGADTPSPLGARFYAGEIRRPLHPYWTPDGEYRSADLDQDSGAMFGLLRDAYPAVNRERVLDQLQPCRRNPARLCAPVAIVLQGDYQTGELLQSSIVLPDTSIASLGLEPGEYVYSWGSGLSADTLTIRIVPEPYFGCGWFTLALLCLLSHRRRRTRRPR